MTTLNLFAKILRAGHSFIGTREEMSAFIYDNKDSFKDNPELKLDDWVKYVVSGHNMYGRFKYICLAGFNRGLAVVVRDGRTEYIDPQNLEKCIDK